MEILFFTPLFKERLWGGVRLKTDFAYPISSNFTGECWAISAHKNGATMIRNGQFAGKDLAGLWEQHPEIFNNGKARPFPLMVKILDANADLSVQVHPNDKFAELIENDLGKAECWYVLDAAPGASIIYGHTANTLEEFKHQAEQKAWDTLLTKLPTQRGDFFAVDPGTVHAIGAGNLILEIQQSSDITYRIYDYERHEANGKLRELHWDKACAVITVPHKNSLAAPNVRSVGTDARFTNLTSNDYFQVAKLELNGGLSLTLRVNYLLVSVIDGMAILNGIEIKKGDHFLVPYAVRKLNLRGYATLIVTNEKSAT